jgi:hypothetical protein
MFYALYQVIVLIATGASAGAWLVRPTRPVLPMAAAGLWVIVTLQARSLEVITDSGTRVAVDGGQAWQLVALALALLNLTTVVLWYLGVYPPVPDDGDGRATIPGQEAD